MTFHLYCKPHELEYSSLYPTDTEIAYYAVHILGKKIEVSLEVRGENAICFRNVWYRDPKAYPEELKELIRREGPRLWTKDENDECIAYADSSSWFEFFVYVNDECLYTEVADDLALRKMTEAQLWQKMAALAAEKGACR